MSGIEVAGFILAICPLVITGLEHYGDGVRMIKKIRDSHRLFRKLKEELECEHDMFLNTLELLLKDCVEEEILADMLAHIDKKKWSNPIVDQCLRDRLQRSYDIYWRCVERIKSSLLNLASDLDLQDDGKGPFQLNKRSVGDALRSLKRGLRFKSYTQILEEIKAANLQLDKLTGQVILLEPIRETRKRVPNFDEERKQATSLHAAILGGLTSSCGAGHRASLSLTPLHRGTCHPSATKGETSFRVVVHHEKSTSRVVQLPWLQREAEFRLLGPTTDLGTAPSQRTIRFQDAQADPIRAALSGILEIQDLCKSLNSFRASGMGECVGFLRDSSRSTRQGLYWPQTPLIVSQTSSVTASLRHILEDARRPDLSEADKRRLALALALAMLRLHDTPWLGTDWGNDKITLIVKDGRIVAEHPFVSVNVLPTHSQLPAGQSCSGSASVLVQNETIFALGIMLIELCLEQPFEQLISADELQPDGKRHEFTEFLTALRLIDKVYETAGDRYGDVVRRCVKCEFDQRRASLHDVRFRKAVWDGVVAPLQHDVDEVQGL